MKHFKLMKGVLACLLSLALVISCFSAVGVDAAVKFETEVNGTKLSWTKANDAIQGIASASAGNTVAVASSGDVVQGFRNSITASTANSGVLIDSLSGAVIADSQAASGTGWTYTSASGFYTSTSADITIPVTLKLEPNVITATYKAETDTVVFEGTKFGTVYYAVVKKGGGKIGKKFSSVELDKDKKAEIALDDAEKGVKADPTKDLYLWFGTSEPDAKKSYKPSLTVSATAYKKFNVTFNYAAASSASGSGVVTLSYKVGKTEKQINVEGVSYRYAKDGSTFSNSGEWNLVTSLSGGALMTAIEDAASDKPVFEFRVNAIAASSGSGKETDPDYVAPTKATRPSKTVKVTLKKAAAAPKAKVDYTKGTVAIKNGFDYAVVTSASGVPSDSGWNTILPVKKDGGATKDIIPTASFVPAAKVTTDTKTSFTKNKVSSISVDKLFEEAEKSKSGASTIYVFIRKSATTKAAPSAYTKLTIAKKAAAPTFTEQTIEGELKKTTWNYTLTAPEALADGTYEYLIIKHSDVLTGDKALDLSNAKWTKLTDKGIVVGKAKSKVTKTVTNTLKADETCDILIRKAAVKSGEDAALASDYVRTTVGKPATTAATADTEATSKLKWSPVTTTSSN